MSTKYYDVDGVPGEWTPGELPRIFVAGQWKTYVNTERFSANAYPITQAQFDAMVAEESVGGGE